MEHISLVVRSADPDSCELIGTQNATLNSMSSSSISQTINEPIFDPSIKLSASNSKIIHKLAHNGAAEIRVENDSASTQSNNLPNPRLVPVSVSNVGISVKTLQKKESDIGVQRSSALSLPRTSEFHISLNHGSVSQESDWSVETGGVSSQDSSIGAEMQHCSLLSSSHRLNNKHSPGLILLASSHDIETDGMSSQNCNSNQSTEQQHLKSNQQYPGLKFQKYKISPKPGVILQVSCSDSTQNKTQVLYSNFPKLNTPPNPGLILCATNVKIENDHKDTQNLTSETRKQHGLLSSQHRGSQVCGRMAVNCVSISSANNLTEANHREYGENEEEVQQSSVSSHAKDTQPFKFSKLPSAGVILCPNSSVNIDRESTQITSPMRAQDYKWNTCRKTSVKLIYPVGNSNVELGLKCIQDRNNQINPGSHLSITRVGNKKSIHHNHLNTALNSLPVTSSLEEKMIFPHEIDSKPKKESFSNKTVTTSTNQLSCHPNTLPNPSLVMNSNVGTDVHVRSSVSSPARIKVDNTLTTQRAVSASGGNNTNHKQRLIFLVPISSFGAGKTHLKTTKPGLIYSVNHSSVDKNEKSRETIGTGSTVEHVYPDLKCSLSKVKIEPDYVTETPTGVKTNTPSPGIIPSILDNSPPGSINNTEPGHGYKRAHTHNRSALASAKSELIELERNSILGIKTTTIPMTIPYHTSLTNPKPIHLVPNTSPRTNVKSSPTEIHTYRKQPPVINVQPATTNVVTDVKNEPYGFEEQKTLQTSCGEQSIPNDFSMKKKSNELEKEETSEENTSNIYSSDEFDTSDESGQFYDSQEDSDSQHESLRRSSRSCVKHVKKKLKMMAKTLIKTEKKRSDSKGIDSVKEKDDDYEPELDYFDDVPLTRKRKTTHKNDDENDECCREEKQNWWELHESTEDEYSSDSPDEIKMTEKSIKSKNLKRKPMTATLKPLDNGTFQCTFCTQIFDSGQNEDHCSEHIKVFVCDICEKHFASKLGLFQHQSKKCKEMNKGGTQECYECHLCSFSCILRNPFVYHMRNAHNDEGFASSEHRKYLCDICGKGFCSTSSLKNHKRKIHQCMQPGEYLCPTCGAQFYEKRQMQHHILTHGEKTVKCRMEGCESLFYNEAIMLHHYRNRHQIKEKKYICTFGQCNKKFLNSKGLTSHINCIHEKSQKFECQWTDCTKVFYSQWHLTIHMRLHTGEEPVNCKFCDYKCRQRAALKWHLRKHGIFNREQEEDALNKLKTK